MGKTRDEEGDGQKVNIICNGEDKALRTFICNSY